METFATVRNTKDETSVDELLKLKDWGLIGEDGEVKGIKIEETPKSLKLKLMKRKSVSNVCSSSAFLTLNSYLPALLASNIFNVSCLNQKSIETANERLLKRKVALLESQCSYFALKFKELEENRQITTPLKPKESDIIYQEHKTELEEKYFGKIVAIDNAERKIVGIGDTILEAFDEANTNTNKTKFSFKRVGYTDRL